MAKRRKQKKSLRRFLPIVDVGLGIAMGCLFAVTYLALKPVDIRDSARRENEKEPGRHDITYVRGRSGLLRSSVIETKQGALVARDPGGVQVSEEEINRWISMQYDQANRSQEFEDWDAEFKIDLPAFRISGGDTQIGMVFDLSVMGLTRKVVLQTTGAFQREAGRFVFVPSSMHLGSCPVNIPYLSRRIFDLVAGQFEVPSDIHAAWRDVRGLVVDNGSMKIDFSATAPRQPESVPVPAVTEEVSSTPEIESPATEAGNPMGAVAGESLADEASPDVALPAAEETTMDATGELESIVDETVSEAPAADQAGEAIAAEGPSTDLSVVDESTTMEPSTDEAAAEATGTGESDAGAAVVEEPEPAAEETAVPETPATSEDAGDSADQPAASQ